MTNTAKVYPFTTNGGNVAANQYIIETSHGEYFQSYNTIIAHKLFTNEGVKITLDRDAWNYSATTGKYRNQFLNEGIVETRAKIASGEYKIANLNK